MKNILFWSGVLLMAYISLGCINTYGEIDEEWESIWENTNKTHSPKVEQFTPAFDKGRALRWLAEYDLNYLYQFDMATQSDIATQCLKLGEFEKALSIFEPLAKKYPNEYKIIANLGTTYELLGQNEKALKFYQKGITT